VIDQTVPNGYAGVPHFVQNLAPSLRELPQFLQMDAMGAAGTGGGAGIAYAGGTDAAPSTGAGEGFLSGAAFFTTM